MLDGAQVFTYVAVAVLAMAISFGVLAITRIPAVVVLSSAIITTALYAVYARLSGAYWDTVAVIALFSVLVYASIIAFAFLGLGRLLHWSLFLEEPKKD